MYYKNTKDAVLFFVSNFCGIDENKIKMKSRIEEYTDARHLYFLYCLENKIGTAKSIASHLGDYDHSSIYHAQRKYNTDNTFR